MLGLHLQKMWQRLGTVEMKRKTTAQRIAMLKFTGNDGRKGQEYKSVLLILEAQTDVHNRRNG